MERLEQIDGQDDYAYEERVTRWCADSIDDAIAMAEEDAGEYADVLPPAEYLGMAQAYELADSPRHGGDVFSLIPDSSLAPGQYLDQFYDTGREHQSRSE